MEEFPKNKSCGKSTHDQWNFKPQISSIFLFDRASDGRMAHVLGIKIFFGCLKECHYPLIQLVKQISENI